MRHLSDQKLSELSEKWLKGTISAQELSLIEEWYCEELEENINWTAGDLDADQLKNRLFYNIDQSIATEKPVRYLLLRSTFYKVAAVITILLGAGVGYMLVKKTETTTAAVVSIPAQINNGNYNKAVLTLAGGQQVELDDAVNGIIAREGSTKIQKTRDGEILYNTLDNNIAAVGINTLATPTGGQYQISLPDGTKVWLNALSTLKFPTAFNGKERVVELKGEAYFEVVKDKSKPFVVKMANETSVEVLGTHFNIMAYPQERSVNATLLEGSINIQKSGLNKRVLPGEMAEVTDKIILQKVNADEVISWKNGLFRFEKADVPTVMREIERWYNVDVVYEEGVPDNEISGFISRSSQLTEVLKMLELSGLKLKTQGNKIKVFKN